MNAVTRIAAATLLTALAIVSVACGSSSATGTPTPSPTPTPTPTSNAAGVAVVAGQLVIAGTSTPFIPRGFTTDGLIYPTQYANTLCTQPDIAPGSPAAQFLQEAQTALTAAPLPGLSYNASFQAMVQNWRLNSVRMQVSQGALQYEAQNGLSAYTDMVRNAVAQARAAGLIVILSMQAERYGCTPYQNGNLQRLPDTNTEQAWAQLLNPTLTNDKGVILEIFNEPDPTVNCNAGTYQQPDWTTWATGCGSEPDQGMLTVGQYLRTLAPSNVLLFDGTGIDFAFVGFTPPSGMPSNSAYTFHPYGYVVNSTLADSTAAWDTRFGNFANSGHAVFVTEWNEAYSCPSDPNQTITNNFIQTYLPSHSIGMMGYAWDAPATSSGYLVNSYDYPGNTANYQLVDPNTSGCAEDGGTVLQKQFQAEAAAS
ncbi:MAG: cellulase family glycosylhydrolase [Acidobacteriaceae bacterium]